MVTQIWLIIVSGNSLFPDGTKPLHEPVLTYHQRGLGAFTWGYYHRKYSGNQSLFENYSFTITTASPIGQCVKVICLTQSCAMSTAVFSKVFMGWSYQYADIRFCTNGLPIHSQSVVPLGGGGGGDFTPHYIGCTKLSMLGLMFIKVGEWHVFNKKYNQKRDK